MAWYGMIDLFANFLSMEFVLLQSYFYNHPFRMRIDKTFSAVYDLEVGIQQGSLRSPTLYNLFTAGMSLPLDYQVQLSRYADDTVI